MTKVCIILVKISDLFPLPGKRQEKIGHSMVWIIVFIFILITQHASPIFLHCILLHQTHKHFITCSCFF